MNPVRISRGFVLSGTDGVRATNHGRLFEPGTAAGESGGVQVRISLALTHAPLPHLWKPSSASDSPADPNAMNPLRSLCLSILLGTCLVQAQAAVTTNPPIRMAPEGTEYMCGGSGQAEAAFMEMVSSRWAASFQFAINQPAGPERGRVAGVQLVVRDAYNGYQVLVVHVDRDGRRAFSRASWPLLTVLEGPGPKVSRAVGPAPADVFQVIAPPFRAQHLGVHGVTRIERIHEGVHQGVAQAR